MTANFQCSGPPQSSFLTGYALNGPSLRNDLWLGGDEVEEGPNPLSVSALGRICVAGNSGTHTVKFVSASTGTDVAGGSVSVSMAGCTAGEFVYASLASAITLQARGQLFWSARKRREGINGTTMVRFRPPMTQQ